MIGSSLTRMLGRSERAGEPYHTPDNMHLINIALIARILRIFRCDLQMMCMARGAGTPGDQIQSLGDQPNPIIKDENAGRRWMPR